MNATQFALKIAQVIVNPIILFLIGAAVLIFVWGVAEYIRGSESDKVRETGRMHMIWGIVGIFIMVSAYTILRILVDTVYG
ncbi:MAG: hypothetical protein RL150_41 [Candidatus Parcubacteria bacterium]|jgi:uncharacterized membrane protein YidH (DUF202 family)